MIRRHPLAIVLALGLLALVAGPGGPARAQTAVPAGESGEVLFEAEDLTYDEKLGRVTATGGVEITQGGRLLLADQVTYDQASGRVIASGNVRIVESSGEVVFAEYVELEQELRDGLIRRIGLLLTDDTRIAAAQATRYGDRITDMRKAVMSPCELCEEDPESAPFWQIKAERVVHDEGVKDIIYYDAFLEVFGVPVFYLPYLRHPDPTVERRSGLLAPSYGTSNQLGAFIKIPYYLNLAPDMDATIEPVILTEFGLIGSGEFRKRFTFGEVTLQGSGGVLDREEDGRVVGDNEFRGHVFIDGEFHLDDNWRAGGQIRRTSDDTYLRRFNFSNDVVLESRGYVEGFWDRSYLIAEAEAFQGLRQDDRHRGTPVILPSIRGDMESTPDGIGGRWSISADALNLGRRDGTNVQRLSAIGGYTVPMLLPGGHLVTAEVSLRGDLYNVSEFIGPESNQLLEGVTGRVVPRAVLDWRYPLERPVGQGSVYVEPRMQLVAAPNGGNPEEIPDEDSQSFALDDTNLFSPRRFAGLDRVDGGIRTDYGISVGGYWPFAQAEMFIGQSYRFEENRVFDLTSGVQEQLSDIVGRIGFTVDEFASGLYRFQLDKDGFTPRRHEFELSAGVRELSVRANYTLLDDQSTEDDFTEREELILSASSQFTDHWALFGDYQRDLAEGEDRRYSVGFSYNDECIIIDGRFVRSLFRDREVEPDNSFQVRVTLKHLGDFGTAF